MSHKIVRISLDIKIDPTYPAKKVAKEVRKLVSHHENGTLDVQD